MSYTFDGLVAANDALNTIIQQGVLSREFLSALVPTLMYRARYEDSSEHAKNMGDEWFMSQPGLLDPSALPLGVDADPTLQKLTWEQWGGQVLPYGGAIEIKMPTDALALPGFFQENGTALVTALGMSLNRVARNRIFATGMAGNTVADGNPSQTLSSTSGTLLVKSLAGFTSARTPATATRDKMRFQPVSNVNPLPIKIKHTAGILSANVVGFTPANAADSLGYGPGTLSLTYTSGTYTVNHRSYVIADDATVMFRSGGSPNKSLDDISSSDLLTAALIRSVTTRFSMMHVPKGPGGYWTCDLDPVSQGQFAADAEVQRLLTGKGLENDLYQSAQIGRALNTQFYENTEAPLAHTIIGGGTSFDLRDPFPGEIATAGSVPVHRLSFYGGGALWERWMDLQSLMSPASVGISGKVVRNPVVTAGSVRIPVDHGEIIFRHPQNILQNLVTVASHFVGDWQARTDYLTGDVARFKRVCVAEHGE